MTYTTKTKSESNPDIHQKYAKLRTKIAHQNTLLRSAYEKQVNEQLRKTVELERQHFQRQVDETVEQANRLIDRANQEANHWRQQVEIIYQLLEDTTKQAEAEMARLKGRIAELESGRKPDKKPKGYRPQRNVEE